MTLAVQIDLPGEPAPAAAAPAPADLADEIDALLGAVEGADQTVLLPRLKQWLDRHQARLRQQFEAGNDAEAVVFGRCRLIDALLRGLLDFAHARVFRMANPTAGERLAVAAVGGYGRGELAPYSDVDLLFLHPYKRTPHIEQMIEFSLYRLWDLGLKVGQATRSVDDCVRLARGDLQICTSLLEARFLWGERTRLRRLPDPLRGRGRRGPRPGVRRGQARRARCPPSAHRRQPLPARAERQGEQRRAQGPADPVLARPFPLPDRRSGGARRPMAC